MSEISLPLNWESCEFGDIARIRNGYAFKSELFKKAQSEADDVPLIRQSQLRGSKIDLSDAVYLSAKHLAQHSDYSIVKGDIIIGMSGSIGKVCRYDHSITSLQNQRTGKIELHSPQSLDANFLGLFLSTIERTLVEKAKGMGVQNISGKDIAALPFSLPPLNEQKRIVAKIEELFSELDAGEESLRKARRQLGVYRQSLLKQAFEGKLTATWRQQNPETESASQLLEQILQRRLELWNGKGVYREPVPPNEEFDRQVPPDWRLASMDALTCHVTSGSRDWTKYYDNGGYAVFVMAQNVRPLRFDDRPVIRVSPPAGDRDKLRSVIACDDLLVTIVGANTGDVCRVNKSLEDYYVCQSVALLRPVECATAEYLELYMNSKEHGQKQFDHWMYGQGRPHLSFDQLRSTAVFLPSLPEQQEIVRLLDEQFTVIEQNEQEIDTALKRSEALRQSILKKAFSGQLVPQDPADEPAGILLERIYAARGSLTKTSKKTGRKLSTAKSR